MSSALGALDFFEVNASTIIVTAYGSILLNVLSRPKLFRIGINAYEYAIVLNNAKNSAAKKISLVSTGRRSLQQEQGNQNL